MAAHKPDILLSDSSLCSVDPATGERDKSGQIAVEGMKDIVVVPVWGASFVGQAWDRPSWWAWRDHGGRRMAVLCAGNDLIGEPGAADIRKAIHDFKSWWASENVEIIVIDVVPPKYHV